MGSARLSWFWRRECLAGKGLGSEPPQARMAKPPRAQTRSSGQVGLPCPGPREAGTGRRAGPEGAVCARYSAEAQAMQRQCTCCRETSTHQQAVTMQCPGGTAVQRTYTHVDACGCAPSCAPSPAAPEHSTPVLPSYGAIV